MMVLTVTGGWRGSNTSEGTECQPAASRKPKSPPGGRKLAAPSETDPVEESSAVVRAVLSKISAPRVTSTAKKERRRGTWPLLLGRPRRRPRASARRRPPGHGFTPAALPALFGRRAPGRRQRGRGQLPRSRSSLGDGCRRRRSDGGCVQISAAVHPAPSRPPRRGRSPRRRRRPRRRRKASRRRPRLSGSALSVKRQGQSGYARARRRLFYRGP